MPSSDMDEFQSSRFSASGRYAVALFELAEEKGALDRLAKDMRILHTMLAESSDLAYAIAASGIDRTERDQALHEIFTQAGLSEMARHFASLVIYNGRSSQLADIAQSFDSLMAKHQGIAYVHVETAGDISQAQLQRIENICHAHFGDKVQIKFHLNPNLIGGITLQMRGHQWDSSMMSKLAQLEKNFMQNLQAAA